MKNKKIFFLLILVLIIILVSLFFIVKNFNGSATKNDNFSEYTPEEEISSKQMRETIVTLFFVDSNNNLKSEGKLIDSAELLNNPYQKLVELLLSGPSSADLKSAFPENTQILGSSIDKNCVTLNFSEEILNFTEDVQKFNIINSVLNTLTGLNEVNSVRFLVNNEVCEAFGEEYAVKKE